MPSDPIKKGRLPLRLREGEAGQPDLLAAPERVDNPGTNAPELTVSELSNALKRTVEDRFGFVRLRGEISNYRGPHSSGHAYFCLKDENARIDAVVWKTTLVRMRVKPEEGLEVVASGKITTFPGKSSYQIVIESLEPAGIGVLMAVLEERRRRFAAEGLFDIARKKGLPYLPHVIGVVTSPTGAVIRDILHRVSARFPRHVVVWPVRVQGETSAAEVAAAIRGFNAIADGSGLPRPHLIIVARGGGSLEDLWGYNDEAVVRAVAEGLIPLISAVGHETDWTLIDHVADVRAPTPTGAAEMALPVLADLFVGLAQIRGRQSSAALRHLDRAQTQLRALARVLPSGADLLAAPHQRLDRTGAQLPGAARAGLDRSRLRLARLSHRLGAQSPQARMARAAQRVIGLADRLVLTREQGIERRRNGVMAVGSRLRAAFEGRLRLIRNQQGHERARLQALSGRIARAGEMSRERGSARLVGLAQVLASLSYRNVLARGFAIVRDPDGKALRSIDAVMQAKRVSLTLTDGAVTAVVNEADREIAEVPPQARDQKPRRKMPDKAASGSLQPSLFDH